MATVFVSQGVPHYDLHSQAPNHDYFHYFFKISFIVFNSPLPAAIGSTPSRWRFLKNTWLPGRPWVPGNMLRSNGGPYVIDHVTKLVAIGI